MVDDRRDSTNPQGLLSNSLPLGRLATSSRWSDRRYLVYLASGNAIIGLLGLVVYAPLVFAADSDTIRQSALALGTGQPGWQSPYPPLTAVVAWPLTWVSSASAAIAIALVSVGLVLLGVLLETRGQARTDRLLVAVAAVTFGPVVYELLLGQTTLLIAAALYPVVRRHDDYWTGIPLGFALALAPKPMLLPLLAWVLVWRRRAFAASLVTAATLTGAGIFVTGWERYREWLLATLSFGHVSLAGDFSRANFSLWAQGFSLPALVLGGVVAAAAGWAILRHPARGLAAALFSSLLLAPYTMIYAASIMLLAVKPMLEFAPRATRLLAFVGSLAVLYLTLLAPWSLAGLVACLPLPGLRAMLPGATRRPRHPA